MPIASKQMLAIIGASVVVLGGVLVLSHYRMSAGPSVAHTASVLASTAPHPALQPGGIPPEYSNMVSIGKSIATRSPAEWNAEYGKAKNAYDFVKKAAPAALAGDARAAYYMAVIASIRCPGFPEKQDGEKENIEDAVLAREQIYAASSGLTASQRVQFNAMDRAQLDFCRQLFQDNAFEGLPANKDYAYPSFWSRMAYAGGDALARVEYAGSKLNHVKDDTSMNAAQRAKSIEQVQSDIYQVVAQAEPAAIFHVASVFGLPGMPGDNGVPQQQTEILMLTACNLGYDCTATNPELLQLHCVTNGTCASGYTLQDWIQSKLNEYRQAINEARSRVPDAIKPQLDAQLPGSYATAYARAQELTRAIQSGDLSGLREITTLPADLVNQHPNERREDAPQE